MSRLGWNRITLIPIAVGVLALVGGGYALAEGNSPSVSPVTATLQGAVTAAPSTTPCRNNPAAYRFSANYAGTVTSDEPALNGTFTLSLSGISDTSTGTLYSAQTGYLRVYNANNRHLQAAGTVQAVQVNTDGYGFVSGTTFATSNESAGRLLGNFTATVTQAGTISGELGGTDNTSAPGNEPAVIVRGYC